MNSDGLCETTAYELVPLYDQKEFWLLRSGLVNIKELCPEAVEKFEFRSNNLALDSVHKLKEGDIVEIKVKKLEVLSSYKILKNVK